MNDQPIATKHVIWDWNGTLFHDSAAVLASTNDAFAIFGRSPLTAEQYRAMFRRPLIDFYTAALARPITLVEFQQLDEVFHTSYNKHRLQCDLTLDARIALNSLAVAGHTQSLLSLWMHTELVELVTTLGLNHFFQRVSGRQEEKVDRQFTKAGLLRTHLNALKITGNDVILIGDAIDDAVAAQAVGAKCVLYTGGSHEPTELAATGFPVVNQLIEAVTYVLSEANEIIDH